MSINHFCTSLPFLLHFTTGFSTLCLFKKNVTKQGKTKLSTFVPIHKLCSQAELPLYKLNFYSIFQYFMHTSLPL